LTGRYVSNDISNGTTAILKVLVIRTGRNNYYQNINTNSPLVFSTQVYVG